jgi:hypothetical protein
MAIVFVTAASVVFGLNWWEKQRRPVRKPKQLPPKRGHSA